MGIVRYVVGVLNQVVVIRRPAISILKHALDGYLHVMDQVR